jgi:nitrite reductase/ring-hydroxylating ferredoxin subunit
MPEERRVRESPADPARPRLDVRVDSPAREGLTGTTPADMFAPLREADQITIAPDWRPMDQQPAWRHDFPVDWPQDHYVERRDFMKFLVLTSLAFTAGQFWIAGQNWWRRRQGEPGSRRVAALADLPAGGVLTFAYPGPDDDCVLIRTRDNALLAYSQKCTHLSCAVLPRVDEGVIHCPCHDGYFDLRSGRPIAGPPQRPLPIIRLDVRDGEIFATGVDLRTA